MPLPSIVEYSNSIKTLALVKAKKLQGGHPIEKKGKQIKYSGGFCVVFPYKTKSNKYAVRCWHASVSDAQERTRKIAEALSKANLPYFVGFDYVSDGIMTPQGLQPIVIMDWVEAKSLKTYISENIKEAKVLEKLAEDFKKMTATLHQHHFSHGDLQHGNIMVRNDGSIVLVDYDSMYVPELEGYSDEIKGLQGYQHEARWANVKLTEKADYFSELVIYLSIKALAKFPNLWYDMHMEDTETMLFSADDISSKGVSNIFKELRQAEDLKIFVDKLIEFMYATSIDELVPLESIKSTNDLLIEISKKWEDNGFDPQKAKIERKEKIHTQIQKIIRKW